MKTYSDELQRRLDIIQQHEQDKTGRFVIVKLWIWRTGLKFKTQSGRLVTSISEFDFAGYRLADDIKCLDIDLLEYARLKTS